MDLGASWRFKLWKLVIQAKNILRAMDLWELDDGSEKPPSNDASEEVTLKYKRNCNRAIAMITTNTGDSKPTWLRLALICLKEFGTL